MSKSEWNLTTTRNSNVRRVLSLHKSKTHEQPLQSDRKRDSLCDMLCVILDIAIRLLFDRSEMVIGEVDDMMMTNKTFLKHTYDTFFKIIAQKQPKKARAIKIKNTKN